MKTYNPFKPLLATLLLSAALLFVSCEKSNDDDFEDVNNNTYTISGNANGDQEVPMVITSATGTLSGSYNANTNMLNYTINWTGMSGILTDAHFHGPASRAVDAPPIHSLNITVNAVNGTASGSIMITDQTEVYLLDGRIYYNLHTALNPGGEIRGQVSATLNN